MKKKEFDMKAFLKSSKEKTNRCAYCKNEELKAAVEDYLSRKLLGDTHFSLNYMYNNCFVPLLGAPKRYEALSNHIRYCLKRDPQTGKSL